MNRRAFFAAAAAFVAAAPLLVAATPLCQVCGRPLLIGREHSHCGGTKFLIPKDQFDKMDHGVWLYDGQTIDYLDSQKTLPMFNYMDALLGATTNTPPRPPRGRRRWRRHRKALLARNGR